MKALVYHDVGDIRLEDVPEPQIREPSDAIVSITTSAICGTDLHLVRGTMPGMKPGTILGHEAVGVIQELGEDVRNFSVGDRVVIPSTIACGYCSYCRAGYFAQCDNMNPHGKQAGTAFYGGPESTGPFDGLQAEKARVPMAAVNLFKIPDDVSDDDAILLSDIFPTGYFGAELADIKPGHTVAVFGCGPVGQCAIASAQLMAAGRIFAVDHVEDRLETARSQGAEVINFDKDDPVEKIRALTGGIGADCAIDAVGVDTEHSPDDSNQEHDPALVQRWAVRALAKAGTLAIIGVYPEGDTSFPIGEAANRNLTIRMGNCNHRKYIPRLMQLVRSGTINPSALITQHEAMDSIVDAYQAFEEHRPGWLKITVTPHTIQ